MFLLSQHPCVIKHSSRVFLQWAADMTHAMDIYRMYFADQFVFLQIAFAVFLFGLSSLDSFLLIFSAAALFSPSTVDRVGRVPLGS